MPAGAPKPDRDELKGPRRTHSDFGDPAGVDVRPPGNVEDQDPATTPTAPVSRSARELLALPESEFVHGCYVAFLGREPTSDELSRQTNRLITWQASRLRIVREMRASPEGRAYKGEVQGLWKVLAADRLYWSPPAKLGRAVLRALRQLRQREYARKLLPFVQPGGPKSARQPLPLVRASFPAKAPGAEPGEPSRNLARTAALVRHRLAMRKQQARTK